MPLMTPAEELRSAAEMIRRHATDVTAGPWKSEASVAHGHRVGTTNDTSWVAWTGEHREENSAQDADWIALLHPGVGLALAKLLDDCAELHEPHTCDKHEGCAPLGCQWCADEDSPCADVRNALAVARQVLGTAA